MCGIAGYIGKKNISDDSIKLTLELLKNRGPDCQDWKKFSVKNTNIYLLHSRLSIIDLDKRSDQPFSYNGRTVIFNGEIYNYVEIREDLVKKGYTFITDSDTEVLLKAYIEYGKKCVKQFNGMWAFIIWDQTLNKLFLSRDRFAEKPLYYYNDNDGIYFASEIKAIQSLLSKKLKINYNHLKRYLVYGYKFLYKTSQTYFHGIKQIEYASNATIDCDINFIQSKYWKPTSNVNNMSLNEAIEGTKHYLLESVKLRLRSDVPLAFCLSGGIDSASLASIAKKIYNYNVSTFSIIDSDERYNELDNIRETIEDLECDHHLIYLNFDNSIERLEDLIIYHDAPISTISYLIHSMLSEKISENNCKVAISGTSADELFTGYYDHFNLHLYEMRNHTKFDKLLNDWNQHIGQFIRNPYLKNPRLYFDDQSFRNHIHLNSDKFSTYLINNKVIDFTESNYSDSLLRNRMLNEMFHETTPVILNEDDLNSMKYSIENRSPYLDVNLFDFANSIPSEYLIQDGYGKYILRESMKGILNEKVRTDKRKKGFNASINSLINLNDKNVTDYLLTESPIFDLVNKSKIENLLKINYYENSYNKFLFNFINTKLFLENF